jgi:hypothetical protein
MFREL